MADSYTAPTFLGNNLPSSNHNPFWKKARILASIEVNRDSMPHVYKSKPGAKLYKKADIDKLENAKR